MAEPRRANFFADAAPDAEAADARHGEAAAAGFPARSTAGVAGPACSSLRFYGYWLFALAAAVSAFASHIYVRHRVVDLGYRLGQERAQRAQFQNDRRDLELELASLEAPADLAQVARDGLGLDVPRDDQMIEVASAPEPGSPDRSAAAVVVSPAETGGAAAVAAAGAGPEGSAGVHLQERAVQGFDPAGGHAATAVTASPPAPPAVPPPAPRRRGRDSRLPNRGLLGGMAAESLRGQPAGEVQPGPLPEGRGSDGDGAPAAEMPAAAAGSAEVAP